MDCEIQILEMDLTTEKLNEKFDSIISSMTLHHINNVDELFKTFYTLLNDKGTIAIADLDTEDGSFHTTDTGVFHHGFDRKEFKKLENIHSMLITKNQKLVFETYFDGFNAQIPHDLRSASKSISSAIIDIAIEENILQGIDQKLYDLLPEAYHYTKDDLK
ncbi:class I SAM-dependent methyltransferase [Aquimarina sp. 2201CG5-10]|uniref:class I SAM-dependent methyltransferase n=1 Tax=Aquimarina callyspongiae TaxID=3098150 RepID=UPI002AB34DB6|nr:methyltransferase domain-containing protein [Aquimarina sp. 2201CG5-10]MDY8134276.1 methyltransferase domain-containing protein [Aquimarina sp. 2201CG5-10]